MVSITPGHKVPLELVNPGSRGTARTYLGDPCLLPWDGASQQNGHSHWLRWVTSSPNLLTPVGEQRETDSKQAQRGLSSRDLRAQHISSRTFMPESAQLWGKSMCVGVGGDCSRDGVRGKGPSPRHPQGAFKIVNVPTEPSRHPWTPWLCQASELVPRTWNSLWAGRVYVTTAILLVPRERHGADRSPGQRPGARSASPGTQGSQNRLSWGRESLPTSPHTLGLPSFPHWGLHLHRGFEIHHLFPHTLSYCQINGDKLRMPLTSSAGQVPHAQPESVLSDLSMASGPPPPHRLPWGPGLQPEQPTHPGPALSCPCILTQAF